MTKSTQRGASPAAPAKPSQNPPGPASLLSGEAPRGVDPLERKAEGAARAWAAFGLRPVAGGYELVRVDMKGNEVVDTTALRQPEPQRGIAFDYLDAEIAEEYLRYKY